MIVCMCVCSCMVEVKRVEGRNEGTGSLKWRYILSGIWSREIVEGFGSRHSSLDLT